MIAKDPVTGYNNVSPTVEMLHTVLVIIKLTKNLVLLRFCCNCSKLKFCRYFTMFCDI